MMAAPADGVYDSRSLAHAVDLQRISSALVVASLEFAAAMLVCLVMYGLVLAAIHVAPIRISGTSDWRCAATKNARRILLASCFLSFVVVFAYTGWLVARGVDVPADTANLLRSIIWMDLARSIARLGLAVVGLLVALGLTRRAL